MQVAHKVSEIRQAVKAARNAGKTVGLVPTMGALHSGHTSLIETARQHCDYVVVSIFVNPTQFAPGEDFEKYPRPIDDDLKICSQKGVDLVFNPDPAEMYPQQQLTWVDLEEITQPLCGRSRPTHFRGVTTVCTKLFNIVQPDKAFFGQKDAQQAAVIRRIVADLNMPLTIVTCPTVREQDGLALSSRNKYLDHEQRNTAPVIYQALRLAQNMIENGETDAQTIRRAIIDKISVYPLFELEYVEIVNPDSMQPLDNIGAKTLIAVAAHIGSTRLIDNILVDANA